MAMLITPEFPEADMDKVIRMCLIHDLGEAFTGDIPTFDKTFMQLGIAAIVLLPYTLITENFGAIEFTLPTVILLLIVGIVHTGISYALYFGAIGKLPSHTVAIFSYIDPIVAIVLSALFLREPMDVFGVIGAVMILSAAFISEMPDKK